MRGKRNFAFPSFAFYDPVSSERLDEMKESDRVGMAETAKVTKQGGSVAKVARQQYEK